VHQIVPHVAVSIRTQIRRSPFRLASAWLSRTNGDELLGGMNSEVSPSTKLRDLWRIGTEQTKP